MDLSLIIGVIVVVSVILIGALLYLLKSDKQQEDVVPVVTLKDFKKDEVFVHEPQSLPIPKPESLAIQKIENSLAEEITRKRITELEEELKMVSDKAVTQAQESLTMIDQIKIKNEELEEQKLNLKSEYENKVNEAGIHLTQLRNDNNTLTAQLNESREKVAVLEEQAIVMKKQLEVEIARFNSQVDEMNNEKEDALKDAVNFEMANLRTENEKLKQSNMELQSSFAQLKQADTDQKEKIDQLQYELTKNRAQVSGLERACENYKVQMEALLSKSESGVIS